MFARAGCSKSRRNERGFKVGGIFIKLLVTIQSHFQSFGAEVFSHHLTYERFWKRYLGVFDSVLVVARVKPVDKVPDGWCKATGVGVEFCEVADYQGPWQYLRVRGRVNSIIKDAIKRADVYLLRVPGMIGTLVWKNLPKGTPFGVEVVIDPWDAFGSGSVRSLGRRFFRWQWSRNLKKQCQQAVAASYVTEHTLQRRYPPNKDAYTTHYSSIELDSNRIIGELSGRLADIKTIPKRLAGVGRAVRLGFVGSFSQGYKLPDVHIKAVAQCVAKGANVSLDMIGDGVLLEEMKALVRRLGISERVKFHGRLPGGKAILDMMDSFDLFLNATAAEGLPRVVIEAMSRGCPCIASDVAGAPELLEPSYLVPVGDVDALVEAIVRMLAEPESMAKAAERNVRVAHNYCRDRLEPRRQAFYAVVRERTEKYLSKRYRSSTVCGKG